MKKSLTYPNKTIYAKVIADMVVLIACLCLDEKNTDVNCVFKQHVSGYICFLSSMCSGYLQFERSCPVFMDGKFVFILFVIVIVLLADET